MGRGERIMMPPIPDEEHESEEHGVFIVDAYDTQTEIPEGADVLVNIDINPDDPDSHMIY